MTAGDFGMVAMLWAGFVVLVTTGFGSVVRLAFGVKQPHQPFLGKFARVVETTGGGKRAAMRNIVFIADDGAWAPKPENMAFDVPEFVVSSVRFPSRPL